MEDGRIECQTSSFEWSNTWRSRRRMTTPMLFCYSLLDDRLALQWHLPMERKESSTSFARSVGEKGKSKKKKMIFQIGDQSFFNAIFRLPHSFSRVHSISYKTPVKRWILQSLLEKETNIGYNLVYEALKNFHFLSLSHPHSLHLSRTEPIKKIPYS